MQIDFRLRCRQAVLAVRRSVCRSFTGTPAACPTILDTTLRRHDLPSDTRSDTVLPPLRRLCDALTPFLRSAGVSSADRTADTPAPAISSAVTHATKAGLLHAAPVGAATTYPRASAIATPRPTQVVNRVDSHATPRPSDDATATRGPRPQPHSAAARSRLCLPLRRRPSPPLRTRISHSSGDGYFPGKSYGTFFRNSTRQCEITASEDGGI